MAGSCMLRYTLLLGGPALRTVVRCPACSVQAAASYLEPPEQSTPARHLELVSSSAQH